MRTIRIVSILSLIFLLHSQLKSQETGYYSNVQRDIDMAKELFANGKYISTFREFQKIQKQVDENSELYSEAEYYKSVSALKAGYTAGSKMLTTFTKDFSESPYINNARF